MRMNKLFMLIAFVGLGIGMITGCGGGSSSSTDDTVIPSDIGFDSDKINENLADVATELGCTYTTASEAITYESDIAFTLKTIGSINKIVAQSEETGAPILAVTEVGTCGGSATIPDDGLFGSYTFDNYCVTDETTGINTTISGSLSVIGDEATSTITLSTPTALTVSSVNPNTLETVNGTLDLDNTVLVINEDNSMDLTIAALTITNNVTNGVYSITNFTANMGEEGITFDGVFNIPQVTGDLEVVGSINTTTGVASITATDEKGSIVTLKSTDVEGVFDVTFDGDPLGTMDCSAVEVPALPVL